MWREIVENILYLLVLINPVSKICILSVFAPDETRKDFFKVIVRSSLVAFIIIALVAVFGEFLLRKVFHVDIYSLRVSGGVVLFWIGFKALSKGVFFELGANSKFAELSIVPLASPLIAGPATITAVVTLGAESGVFTILTAAAIAIAINLALMAMSNILGKILTKFNVMGALIRMTGLVVISIGSQMIFSGVSEWIKLVASDF